MKICPSCNKEFNPDRNKDHFPFCSERCRLLDLGAWLTEKHRIPSEEVEIPTDEDPSDITRH